LNPVARIDSSSWSLPQQRSSSRRSRLAFRPGCPEVDRTGVRALLLAPPPPGGIFAPGRRPAVLLRLHTADHIRRASPVQEEQSAPTACDWARIMGFTVGKQEDAVTLLCTHHRQRIFSCMLHHNRLLSSLCDGLPSRSDARRRVDASRPVRAGYSRSGQGASASLRPRPPLGLCPHSPGKAAKTMPPCARAEEKLRHGAAILWRRGVHRDANPEVSLVPKRAHRRCSARFSPDQRLHSPVWYRSCSLSELSPCIPACGGAVQYASTTPPHASVASEIRKGAGHGRNADVPCL